MRRTKRRESRRSRTREGLQPKGICEAKAHAVHRDGKRVTGGGADTVGYKEKTEGEAHGTVHYNTTDALCGSFYSLKKNAAAGVDGVLWNEYERE